MNVSVCDFEYPEECDKKVPYKGAPDDYDCGRGGGSHYITPTRVVV